jgi:hypothetical protein
VTAERVRAAVAAGGAAVTIGAAATAVATAPGVAPSADAAVGRLIAARLTGPGIDDGGVVAVWIVQPSGALASLNPLAASFSAAPRLNGWQAWRADWERVAACV